MEPSNFYPPHIPDLLYSLEASDYAFNTLLAYHSKTISDPLLDRIYTSLDFPNTLQIPSKQVRNLILDEYMSDFPPIDEEMSKGFETFVMDSNDLAADLVKEDLFESKSVSSCQSEETSSTPMKYSPKVKRVPRSKNGLKALSLKVKEIVERLGSGTYQEVADCLVREEIDLKAEKNIRRRVYDALNVLIAVGVLRKYSKTVEPIKRLKINTQEKVKNLKSITGKFLRLKAVIERNKNQKKKDQKLFMPFSLVAVPKGEESSAKITMNLHRNNTMIGMEKGFVVKNSDEVLKYLELEVGEDWVPKEVMGLCDFSYNNSQVF